MSDRPVPLQLMIRRLAPFVADGLVDFTEAHDLIMLTALHRGMCESSGREQATHAWVTKTLDREAAKAQGLPT